MEKLVFYKKVIETLLTEHAKGSLSTAEDVRFRFIHDKEKDEYILLMMGWKKHRYNHGVLFHVQIVDGKIWIHQDRTDIDIAKELIQAGIPKSEIVLGYVQPFIRDGAGFALA